MEDGEGEDEVDWRPWRWQIGLAKAFEDLDYRVAEVSCATYRLEAR